MSVFQRGEYWWYEFQLFGERYRRPCGKNCKSKTRARQIEDNARAAVLAGESGPARRAPLLSDFAAHFLKFVDEASTAGHFAPNTHLHYRHGVRLLKETVVWNLRLDQITDEIAARLQFPGPSSGNKALRTLRRILGLAHDRKLIRKVPSFKLFEDRERTAIIEPWLEDLMLECAKPPLREVIIIMLDSFMRPAEVVAMRWENILWDRNLIYIPKSKTPKGRRYVGLTERMKFELRLRWQDSASHKGWVFPSNGGKSGRKSSCGHTLPSSLDKMWRTMKVQCIAVIAKRGLPVWPEGLVLYSCRHTGATHYSEAVGNETKVANVLGHADTRNTRRYLHHLVDSGKVMDERNAARLQLVKKGA